MLREVVELFSGAGVEADRFPLDDRVPLIVCNFHAYHCNRQQIEN